jgi:L-ascorbate metabolism protein UlaG (beta-lactamase superfamily)
LALLPINGRDSARGVPGNFTAEEAAQLGKQMRAGLVIPCHYQMFEFNTVSPEGFARAAQELGQNDRILNAGSAWIYESWSRIPCTISWTGFDT